MANLSSVAVVGLAGGLLTLLLIPAGAVGAAEDKPKSVTISHVVASAGPAAMPSADELVSRGQARYQSEVRDYRCTFVKQERIKGRLTAVQEIEVLFRREPHSVFMKWKINPDKVKRALWIDHPSHVDKSGRKVARIEPAGAIARAFVSEVQRPIHSDEARELSRRSLDEFGFGSTFHLLMTYNEVARQKGVLDFRYVGEGEIDGRKTFVLERTLPFTGEGGAFPDALMRLHLDQEWLLPTAVYSYADRAGRDLLGSYVMRSVVLNPGLSDSDFAF